MHTIELNTPFSESCIWQLQRDYFDTAGIDAWRTGQVPHYVTSNPAVGKTYAELVLALLRDRAMKGQQTETVYLLELGAGHGRLCYHFLKHFESNYERSALKLPPFCYVLSDFTESNLAFWRSHPRFQPYFEKGWLDLARFNVESDSEIKLENSGKWIRPGNLAQPIVAIANYFFDSIPQELFRIKDNQLERALVNITAGLDPKTADPIELIRTFELNYTYEPVTDPVYLEEPVLNDLLSFYREQLTDAHLLFPYTGLRCLERLRSLSTSGLVLLSADRGEHHLSNLDYQPSSKLITHGGCFSLDVNYHALKLYGENEQGVALFSHHQHSCLDLGCLLLLGDPSGYTETLSAYDQFVRDYGPDDFFSLKKLVEKNFGQLTVRDILATTRLSGYDAHIFQQMLPDLLAQIENLSDDDRWNLYVIIPRIWETYFPIQEARDLAANLGNLLMALQYYEEALLFYEQSIAMYGEMDQTLYSMAVCHCMLDHFDTAQPIIDELVASHPGNEALKELIAEFELA